MGSRAIMRSTFSHIFLLGSFGLTCLAPSLQAQGQSNLDRLIAKLEHSASTIPRVINKIVRCVQGDTSCTTAEIRKARVILSTISITLITMLLLSAVALGKRQGWLTLGSKDPMSDKNKKLFLQKSKFIDFLTDLKEQPSSTIYTELYNFRLENKEFIADLNPHEQFGGIMGKKTWKDRINEAIGNKLNPEQIRTVLGRPNWPG